MANLKSNPYIVRATSISVGLGAAAAALGATTNPGAGHYMTPGEMPSAAQTSPAGEYVDEKLLTAKLEAVEARTETKFAQLLGELQLLTHKMGDLDNKIGQVDRHVGSSKGVIVTAIIGSALAIVGLSYAAVQIFEAAISLGVGK